jgi:hypothetical protein
MPTLPPDSPETLWQSQPEEGVAMSLDEIRKRVRKFETQIRRRNTREYLAATVAAVVLGAVVWFLPGPLERLGAALMLLGLGYVVVRLRAVGASRDLPVEASASACLHFYRQEVARQRDLLREAASWHIAAFLPGVILLFIGTSMKVPDRIGIAILIASATLAAAVLAVVSALNAREANRLQRELEGLE